MNRNQLTSNSFLFLILGCSAITYSTATVAQRLPEPPSIRSVSPTSSTTRTTTRNVPARESTSISITPRSSSTIREYIFEVPNSSTQSPPKNPSLNRSSSIPIPNRSPQFSGLYRVEVSGDSELLLSKVKIIEPLAFVRLREGVIQAGLFEQQKQAEERVNKLQKQGLQAKVVTLSNDLRSVNNVPMRRQIR